MTEDIRPSSDRLKQARLFLWAIVGLALLAVSAMLLLRRDGSVQSLPKTVTTTKAAFGGPFTLVGSDGKPFSSSQLLGKPYAIFFGFTRCGDVCPTTLSRLVKLRGQAGGENAFNIVFVTIDPEYDGPEIVGQYAKLFNSPIIGLTGSTAQVEQVKKQYGIHAEKHAHAKPGAEMEHSDSVLLIDKAGQFVTVMSSHDDDAVALDKIKQIA